MTSEEVRRHHTNVKRVELTSEEISKQNVYKGYDYDHFHIPKLTNLFLLVLMASGTLGSNTVRMVLSLSHHHHHHLPSHLPLHPLHLITSTTTPALIFLLLTLGPGRVARSAPPVDDVISDIMASNMTSEEKFKAVLQLQHRRYCQTSRTCLGLGYGRCHYCRPCQCDDDCRRYGDCCPDKLLEVVEEVQPITIPLACRNNLYSGYTEEQLRSRRPNATSFLMTAKCPPSAPAELARQCGQGSNHGPVSTVPVGDWEGPAEGARASRVAVFANIHCAKCHGVQQSRALLWKTILHCPNDKNFTSTEGEQLAQEAAQENDCFLVYFPPPSLPSPRQCYYDDTMITSCNVTGAWPEADPFTERACAAYLDPKMAEGKLFQNVFCYICNSAEPDRFAFCERTGEGISPMPFSALLDFSDVVYGKSTQSEVKCEESEIYDDSSDQCRKVMCSPGRLYVDGRCSPVFSSIRHFTYSLYFGAILDADLDLYDGNDLLHRLPGRLQTLVIIEMLQGSVRPTCFQVSFEITDEDGRCSQKTREFSVFCTFKVMSDVKQDDFEQQLLKLRNTSVSLRITPQLLVNFTTKLLEIQPSTQNFELVNRLRELRLGVGLPRKRGCRGGRKKLRSIQVVPSRNLHPLMVPPFLQPHPDLQSAVGNAPLSSKHSTQLPTTDCLLSIIPLMGGQPSDAPALSPPSPLQQGGQSSNAPALSPPSPLPQGGQPIALALSPSSPPPQDGQPSDAPGLSPSSSTLLLCPSDSTLSSCHLNSQSAVKTDEHVWLRKKNSANKMAGGSCSTTVSNFHQAVDGDADAANTRVTQLLTLPKVALTHDEFHVQETDLGVKVAWMDEPIPLGRYESTDDGNVYIALADFMPKITAYRQQVTEANEAEVMLSIVCTCLSLAGLVVTLFTYCLFKSLRTAPGRNNINLCVALFMAQLFYLVGSGWDEIPGLCQAMGIVIHYFWLAAFAAMSVCSFHMWRIFTSFRTDDDLQQQKRRLLHYTLYIWASAALVVVLTLCLHMIATGGQDIGYGGKYCYLSTPVGVGVAMGVPVALTLVTNGTCFCLTVRTIRLSPKLLSKSREDERHVWVYLKLSTITGVTWILAFVVFFTEVVHLRYLFTLVNGLQGMFVCLSFVCNRRVAKLYLACCKGDHQPRLSTTTTSASAHSSTSSRNGHVSTISQRTETSFTDPADIKA
ncbi:hypothetical protein ACOMHN_015594 [Nucella lapillus]